MHLWAIQEFSIYSKGVLEARPQLRSVAHKHTALLSVHLCERRYDCILHHIAGVLYRLTAHYISYPGLHVQIGRGDTVQGVRPSGAGGVWTQTGEGALAPHE